MLLGSVVGIGAADSRARPLHRQWCETSRSSSSPGPPVVSQAMGHDITKDETADPDHMGGAHRFRAAASLAGRLFETFILDVGREMASPSLSPRH